MASVTSGEIARFDWFRNIFSGPLLSCNIINFLLTSLARSLLRNIGPRSFCTNLALRARPVQKDLGPIFLGKDLALS